MKAKERKELEKQYRQVLLNFRDRHEPGIDLHYETTKQIEKGIVVVKIRKWYAPDSPTMQGVVMFGDRLSSGPIWKRSAFVVFDDMAEYNAWPTTKNYGAYANVSIGSLEFVTPGLRKIHFPLGAYMGTSSLMARIGKGISLGKTFRAR